MIFRYLRLDVPQSATHLEVMPMGVKLARTRTLEGGGKALLSYIDLEVTDSVGGQNHAKLFILGAMPRALPAGTSLATILV